MFNKTMILALTCASLSLGGCETLKTGADTAKSWVYSKGAASLNNYCVVRDPAIASALTGRVNDGLTDAGFEGTVELKVNCP